MPDTSILLSSGHTGAMHVQTARDRRGPYLMAYTPYGSPIDIDLSVLSGETRRAWWFDPQTEASTEIGTLRSDDAQDPQRFDPPGAEVRGNDWLLVVDDAAAGFDPPGERPCDPLK